MREEAAGRLEKRGAPGVLVYMLILFVNHACPSVHLARRHAAAHATREIWVLHETVLATDGAAARGGAVAAPRGALRHLYRGGEKNGIGRESERR